MIVRTHEECECGGEFMLETNASQANAKRDETWVGYVGDIAKCDSCDNRRSVDVDDQPGENVGYLAPELP